MEEKYKHINGWGIDADPENEPTYPMKKWTGDDHNRSNYARPIQQEVDVEILHSNERPTVSAVFGATCPPSGLSGMLRRYAFRNSESKLSHWLPLILADRINVWEGIIDDFSHGHVPNVFAERGLKAEWEHNPKGVVKKVATYALIAGGIFLLLNARNKKQNKKRSHA